VPAVREAQIEESRKAVAAFIQQLRSSTIDIVVFQTGAGVSALLREAEQLEQLPDLLAALCRVQVVCRGPKPAAVLKRYHIPISLSDKEPHTTETLISVLEQQGLRGKVCALLHYGERNQRLLEALLAHDVRIEELCLYQWRLPEDLTGLRALVQQIIGRQVDAVVFTSQIQARHLFAIATELHLHDELRIALNARTIVASIGPTCTDALQHYGVQPHVIPRHPKMGHLIKALVEHMQ
jgi:uroporphyrinogen-III synthase